MGHLQEKVAYLKGLAEGLDLEKDEPEGRLLLEIISVLDNVAKELSKLGEDQKDIEDCMDALAEGISELEDDYWGGYDEDATDDIFGDDDFIEMECPSCHETMFFESNILDDDGVDQITCPECGEVIFDFSEAPLEEDIETPDAVED